MRNNLNGKSLSPKVIAESKRLLNRIKLVHGITKFLCIDSPLRVGNFIDRITAQIFSKKLHYPSISRVISYNFAKLILPKPNGVIVCPTIYDFNLCFSLANGMNYYMRGYYEYTTLDIMKKFLKDGDTFIDIGASVGQMSIFASKIVGKKGKVYSFEPSPSRFDELTQGIHINKCTNMTPFNMGLGDKIGKIKLYLDLASPTMLTPSSRISKEKRYRKNNSVDVKISKLDNIIKEKKIKNIKMIKIDVEGFELNVLKGSRDILSSKNPPVICFEYGAFFSSKNIFHFIRKQNSEYEFYYSDYGNEVPNPKLVKVNIDRLQTIPEETNIYAVPKKLRRYINNLVIK